MEIDLSIIIVNWNSANFLKKCLESISNTTKGITFEIIVVDNASYDGCERIAEEDSLDIVFVQSDRNVGFGKANNLGYRYSSGRNLLFLNPDTEVLQSAIPEMLRYLDSMKDAGAIGCKLLNGDRSPQTSCIQAFPTIMNQLVDMEYLRKRFPMWDFWGIKALFSDQQYPVEVDVVSGACIMIKHDVFEEVELFSTDYFMYAEDVDLCFRIKKAGYKVYYTNKASIVHHGSGSTNCRSEVIFPVLMMRESVLGFLKKTRGAIYGEIYRFAMITLSLTRLFIIGSLLPFSRFELNKRSLLYSFRKWWITLLWSLGCYKNHLSGYCK
jgi:hypothetical protein